MSSEARAQGQGGRSEKEQIYPECSFFWAQKCVNRGPSQQTEMGFQAREASSRVTSRGLISQGLPELLKASHNSYLFTDSKNLPLLPIFLFPCLRTFVLTSPQSCSFILTPSLHNTILPHPLSLLQLSTPLGHMVTADEKWRWKDLFSFSICSFR